MSQPAVAAVVVAMSPGGFDEFRDALGGGHQIIVEIEAPRSLDFPSEGIALLGTVIAIEIPELGMFGKLVERSFGFGRTEDVNGGRDPQSGECFFTRMRHFCSLTFAVIVDDDDLDFLHGYMEME